MFLGSVRGHTGISSFHQKWKSGISHKGLNWGQCNSECPGGNSWSIFLVKLYFQGDVLSGGSNVKLRQPNIFHLIKYILRIPLNVTAGNNTPQHNLNLNNWTHVHLESCPNADTPCSSLHVCMVHYNTCMLCQLVAWYLIWISLLSEPHNLIRGGTMPWMMMP